jgi:hypothetical protein
MVTGKKSAHGALAMIEYRDSPSVCLFADSKDALARLKRDAGQAGYRIVAAIDIDEVATADWPGGTAAPILVEADQTGNPRQLDRLLHWVGNEAGRGRRAVVAAPFDMTDRLAAQTWMAGIEWLIDADPRDRAATFAAAAVPAEARLHDIGRDDGSMILQQLTHDVGRIAALLASLSDEERAEGVPATGQGRTGSREPGIDAPHLRAMIRARRLRDQYFRGDLFADPAWDMLLDLMAARLEGSRVAVSSLCIAAAVPATTALRWIKALTDRGLFVRVADPQDGRRVFIELADDAMDSLAAYFQAAGRIAAAPI